MHFNLKNMHNTTRLQTSKLKSQKIKTDTKKILMNAGIALFARNGYEGTSVKEIADEANVNISLISYHYDGKEGLYRACIDEFAKQRLMVSQRVLTSAKNLEEFRIRLQMFIEEYLICFIEQPEITKIVQRECEKKFPIVQDIFDKTFLKMFKNIVEFVAEGQRNGFLRKEIDPVVFATSFMGSITNFSRVDNLSEKYFRNSIRKSSYRQIVSEQLLNFTLKGVIK